MKKMLFFSLTLVTLTFAKSKTYNLLTDDDICKFHKDKDQVQNVRDFDQMVGLINYTVSSFPDKIFYSCKTRDDKIDTRYIEFVSNYDVRYNTDTIGGTIIAFYAENIIVLQDYDLEWS